MGKAKPTKKCNGLEPFAGRLFQLPFGDRRPPLPASLLMHVAGYGLEHHYGDTRTPCHSGCWSPAPPGALLWTSRMMSPCVFS